MSTLSAKVLTPKKGKAEFGFVLLIIFLAFEYGRPQDKLAFIGVLRPGITLMTLMVLSWFSCKSIRPLQNTQFGLILLFALWITVLLPFASNGSWALKVVQGFYLLFPLCISIALFVTTFEKLRTYMKWWCALGLYIAINGVFNKGVAGSSFLADENDFSLLMNMMQPFALCLFFYERKRYVKLFYLLTSLVCVFSIVASGSRGGFVGLIVVLSIIWLASPRKILSLVLVSILALGVLAFADQKYWDRMSTIENTDEGTAKERIDSWEAGWEMFKDNPVGVGPGNFPYRFPEYQPKHMPKNMYGRAAHSLWFTLLPETGVIGTLLYFSLMALNFRTLNYLRKLPQVDDDNRYMYFMSLAFIASLAGFFASGTFISVLYYPHFWYLTAMIVACRNIAKSHSMNSANASKNLSDTQIS